MSSACCPKYFFRFLLAGLLCVTVGHLAASPALTPFNDFLSPLKTSLGQRPRKATIPPANYRLRTVVIDAGHGGKDPGGMGANSKEKHIALSIATRLRDLIQANYPEITVIMTRATDEFIPLYERAAIANRHKADLFISIHANIMPGSKATYGTETFVMGQHVANYNLDVAKRENASILLEADYETNYDYDPNSDEGHILMSMYQNAFLEQSILFAELVEQQFANHAGRKSRGVKQAGFVVLKATAMPSVLVETGFMSNPKEEQYLLSQTGQYQLAAAIFEAFSAYRQLIDAKDKSTTRTDKPAFQPVSTNQRPTEIMVPPPAAPQPVSRRAQRRLARKGIETTTVPETARPVSVVMPPASNDVKKDDVRPAVLAREVTTTANRPAIYSAPVIVPAQVVQPAGGQETATYQEVIYAIQLAATQRELALTEPRWQAMTMPLVVVEEDGLFKYQARGLDTPQSALKAKKQLRELGFEQAFIVAYQNGRRIVGRELEKLLENND